MCFVIVYFLKRRPFPSLYKEILSSLKTIFGLTGQLPIVLTQLGWDSFRIVVENTNGRELKKLSRTDRFINSLSALPIKPCDLLPVR